MLSRNDRLKRLAKALGMTPSPYLRMEKHNRWWLCGCVEGDQPLPRTYNCLTAEQAVSAAEDWLAPEIAGLEEKNQNELRARAVRHAAQIAWERLVETLGYSRENGPADTEEAMAEGRDVTLAVLDEIADEMERGDL